MRQLLPLMLILGACTGGGGDNDDGPNIREIEDENYEDAGFDLEFVTEKHSQVGVPEVDVLWVIDNSRSMYEEQTALSNNFTSFMKSFEEAKLDYHIAVMSTGWDDEEQRGKFRTAVDRRGDTIRWIDNTVPEPDAVFRDMALMGIDGPLEEKGRAQVYTALNLFGLTENFGFLRDEAFLSVIVLSDEDDRSGNVPVDNDRFIEWLRSLKDSPEQVSFSSIVGPTGGCGNAGEGTDYLAVTDAIGGLAHSICNPSWANVLAELGDRAAGLRREFTLREFPDPDSFDVSFKEPGEPRVTQTLGLHFDYDRARNSIVFTEEAPPANSVLTVTYATMASVEAAGE